MAIERQRASAVCVHAGQVLCVRLRDPSTLVARLFVPGGAIEPGESAAQAAVRETLEETGYAIVVDAKRALVVRYPFVWNDQDFDVTTHFFPATLSSPAAPTLVNDAAYLESVHWIPLSGIQAAFEFNADILSAVMHVLRSDTDI